MDNKKDEDKYCPMCFSVLRVRETVNWISEKCLVCGYNSSSRNYTDSLSNVEKRHDLVLLSDEVDEDTFINKLLYRWDLG